MYWSVLTEINTTPGTFPVPVTEIYTLIDLMTETETETETNIETETKAETNTEIQTRFLPQMCFVVQAGSFHNGLLGSMSEEDNSGATSLLIELVILNGNVSKVLRAVVKSFRESGDLLLISKADINVGKGILHVGKGRWNMNDESC